MATRTVETGDGIAWLRASALGDEHAIVTSLPDLSAFPKMDLAQWSEWFTDTAALCCRAASDHGVVIFYQTDIKHDGRWVDKSQLLHAGAVRAQSACLWHKIVCRVPPGTRTFGRPAFGHLLCFSRSTRLDAADSTPDVLPDLGLMTWSRAMPTSAAEAVCRFLRGVGITGVVVDPFCGHGTILAVANAHGFDAIGVEISRRRAKKARNLELPEVSQPRPRPDRGR